MENKVSIILPAYNCQETIENAIESVISQDYKNWELIIIDDGSTDNTKEKCQKYNDNKNIKFFSKKNEGPSATRNYGLKKSTGKYIMFLDSDDYFESTMVSEMVKKIQENNQLVCCNFFQFYNTKKDFSNIEQLKTKDIQLYIETLQKNRIFNNIWNKIYVSEIISENNITFNENIEFGEDYEFNIDYIKSVEQAELINEPLYNYYISSNSLTTKYRENEFQIRKHNIDKNKELYRHKNYDLEWISHLYLEMFIQSSISLFNNKSASKNTIISKIKEYSETIYNDIKANYQNFFRKEEIFVGKMIYRKKYHVIYRYIKLRILIKKIIYKLRRKKNR